MKITYYKNSFWASVVNILGYGFIIMAIGGIFAITDGDASVIEGILILVIFGGIGGLLIHLAEQISEKKVFKDWLKANAGINLEEQIKASEDFAFKVYNACPNKYNLKFITSLNSEAGAQIAASIGRK